MVAYEPWPAWVELSINEIERKFDLTGGTYRGHADGDPGHDMTGDLAVDFWTTDKLVHDAVLRWFQVHAVRIGATYIITWRRIWSVARASEGVRVYDRYDPPPNTASQDHTNHIHISYGTTPPLEEDMPLSDSDWAKLEAMIKRLVPTANQNADAVLTRDGKIKNIWQREGAGTHTSLASAVEEIGKDTLPPV